MRVAIDFGLVLRSDFGNVKRVIAKIVALLREPGYVYPLFENLLEVSREKRLAQKRLLEIQRKMYIQEE